MKVERHFGNWPVRLTEMRHKFGTSGDSRGDCWKYHREFGNIKYNKLIVSNLSIID
jgi:hypothetical protein